MPIYEYRCEGCGRKASLFFRSIGAVEDSPACPHCGQQALSRRMSRVWARSRSSDDETWSEPSDEQDGVPFYGGAGAAGFDDPYGGGLGGDEPGDEDVAALARETRMMAEMMGEPIDADFDQALRHIEQGADPDDVFGELDESAPEPADGAE